MIDTNEFYVDFKKEIQNIRQLLDSKTISPPQALERQDVLASKCRHNLMFLPVRDQDTYNFKAQIQVQAQKFDTKGRLKSKHAHVTRRRHNYG
ncbi:hypothetical protein CJU89_2477 [Yarrowia sp. B02]|nr:hypothetical protein CJU89_2477 [Yarrowia sp. B02]